jgi:ABC-type transporter Mla MlaB component
MLRIDTTETSDATLLTVEGRIVGRWVDAVAQSCSAARARGQSIVLDLAGVSFVEPEGIALLHRLQTEAVALVNPTPFVSEQLRGVTP